MSPQHRFVLAYLVVTGAGRRWRTAASLRHAVERRKPWPASPPRSQAGVPVGVRDDDGWPVVTLGPPSERGAVLALHGGGYVFGPESQHWALWRTVVRSSGRRVVAPLYRLAPEGNAADTVRHVARIAAGLAAEGPLALLGDSAGGGLALAVAQRLRGRGVLTPLLLAAPWLDATVSDPRSAGIRDPWLAAPGLREAARLYGGSLPLEHPLLSPLFADLAGLGAITVASGTRDVLHPDALRLADLAAQPGTPVRLLVGEGLLHNYPLLPIPEARPAVRAFLDALR